MKLSHGLRALRRRHMAEMYAECKSARLVSESFNVTEVTVYAALKEHGIKPATTRKPKAPPSRPSERVVEVSELSSKGMSQSEIARRLGVTRARVNQLVDRAEKWGLPVVRRKAPAMEARRCVCGIVFTCRKSSSQQYHSVECARNWCHKRGGKSSEYVYRKFTCSGCGSKFERSNRLEYIRAKVGEYRGKPLSGRRYCTHTCYINSRYKKGGVR